MLPSSGMAKKRLNWLEITKEIFHVSTKLHWILAFYKNASCFDSSPSSLISSSVDANFMIRKPVADSRRTCYRWKLSRRQFYAASTWCRLNPFCPPWRLFCLHWILATSAPRLKQKRRRLKIGCLQNLNGNSITWSADMVYHRFRIWAMTVWSSIIRIGLWQRLKKWFWQGACVSVSHRKLLTE